MQRADKRHYHYIYKITRDDGKYYIGMHSTDELEDGYFGSGKLITRSVKKYGVEKHQKEILEFLPSRSLLKEREKEIITLEMRADKKCMNIAPGGGGGFISEEMQFKRASAAGKAASKVFTKGSIAAKQRAAATVKTTKIRRERGVLRNWCGENFRGKSHTAETKAKMSASQQGKQLGQRNSQFGTCWITDGVKPIKIKKDQLDEYLTNGYSRGRK